MVKVPKVNYYNEGFKTYYDYVNKYFCLAYTGSPRIL